LEGTGVLGYYSMKSNRVVMYDRSGGRVDDKNGQLNAATIIHEVTHQTAFNTGIHNRFAPQPAWVVEGLGTMFEAPGVFDSRNNRSRKRRINRQRLADFKRYAASRSPKDSLTQLISSDRRFESDPIASYAKAWAFSFYLAETKPRKYFQYLARVGSRANFQSYPSRERLKDFTDIFGDEFPMHEARLLLAGSSDTMMGARSA